MGFVPSSPIFLLSPVFPVRLSCPRFSRSGEPFFPIHRPLTRTHRYRLLRRLLLLLLTFRLTCSITETGLLSD
jgi:hypothetical protein